MQWIEYIVCFVKLTQGSYRSWKTWKVMEFKNFISRPGKSLNLILLILESHGKFKFCLVDYMYFLRMTKPAGIM